MAFHWLPLSWRQVVVEVGWRTLFQPQVSLCRRRGLAYLLQLLSFACGICDVLMGKTPKHSKHREVRRARMKHHPGMQVRKGQAEEKWWGKCWRCPPEGRGCPTASFLVPAKAPPHTHTPPRFYSPEHLPCKEDKKKTSEKPFTLSVVAVDFTELLNNNNNKLQHLGCAHFPDEKKQA